MTATSSSHDMSAHRMAVIGAGSQVIMLVGSHLLRASADAAILKAQLHDPTSVDETVDRLKAAGGDLNEAAMQFAIFYLVASLGMVLFIIAITRFKYRRAWAFWYSVLYGGLLVFTIPLGWPWGLFLIAYALIKRAEFLRPVA